MARNTEWVDMSESGNWNVAKNFSELKIMRHLYVIDEYEIIATFGTVELVEEFNTPQEFKSRSRIIALERMAKHLEILIGNTIFAIRDKQDRADMQSYREMVCRIKKLIHTTHYETINQRDKKREVKIKEKEFMELLETLIDIKIKINVPLNKSELIFKNFEEFDPDKMKEKIIDDLVNGG